MTIEKKQTVANTKGFTLVELIVVITILAVLAAIAFISIGNVTGDARNSKRTNDLSSISTAIRQRVEINGMPITNVVSSGATKYLSGTFYIAGRNVGSPTERDPSLEYSAGDVNYSNLQIKDTEFKDPNGIPYIVGATKLAGQVFEIAGTLEKEGNKKEAIVIGTYVPRTLASQTQLSGSGKVDALDTHRIITLQNDTDIGKFKVMDIINNGTYDGQIRSVSSDGRTITYDPVTLSGVTHTYDVLASGSGGWVDGDATIKLGSTSAGNTEALGLIFGTNASSANSCSSLPVTDKSTNCVPY